MGINRATVGIVHHSDPSLHIGAQILHHSSPFLLKLFVFVLQKRRSTITSVINGAYQRNKTKVDGHELRSIFLLNMIGQGQNLDMFVDALLLNPSLHVLRSGSEDARTALHQVGSAHFAFDSADL
ncbi:uncharacterized protein LOC111466613 isoform X2 [Cucurbita maxima]|uniref:Uncharacterized protein LOC111466613 isoform X2 n=1 Tax=Cucurbita maxima TaxID=3661 RepID=A0A6J1HPV4_CUCMA|nr:uncharacterized protein LOC111466613 isoform X2 [Cucurbita maxima]